MPKTFQDPPKDQPQDHNLHKTSKVIRKKAKGTRQKLDRTETPPKSTFQCNFAPVKVRVVRVEKDRCPVPVRQGTLRSFFKPRL